MLTMHLSEVTKERAVFLYAILMGKKINVGRWVQHNINHAIRQGFKGSPHPTLLTELIASHGIDTVGAEILQPKGPLHRKGIKHIMIHELREDVTGASSFGAKAPYPARPPQTCPTIADLTRAIECHKAQLHGIRNWMVAKAAYDRNMGKAMCARLDALIQNSGVDPASMPRVPIYSKNLTHRWEPEEPPYKEEEDDDEETDDK